MTMGEVQREFAKNVGLLITRIYEAGFACTLGEAWRTDEQSEINAMGDGNRSRLISMLVRSGDVAFQPLATAIGNNVGNGIRGSLHQDKLAIDLNLFRIEADGSATYLAKSEDHRPFGEWWESTNPLARWGGRFGDGNHYSFSWGGRK